MTKIKQVNHPKITFFQTVLLATFSFSSFSLCADSDQPNFVFIFADDLSYEAVGIRGLTEVKTPHLDKLAKRGADFTQAYNMGAWGGAVCVASRTMLMSGATVNRARKAISQVKHWSTLMKEAGYKTYMTGKWHIPGQPKFDVIKSKRPGMPNQTPEGYNRPKDPNAYENGWKPWDKSKNGFWKGGTHWSEVVAKHSVDFIDDAAKQKKPFFMYLSFNAPHDPRQAPKKYIDMYPISNIKVPQSFMETYPEAKHIGCDPTKLRDERLMPNPRTEYSIKIHRQEYFAIITHMDEQIGKILRHLRNKGLDKNTYIVFTSDHGLSVGHHGLAGKQNMYEHTMKVPFFIAGPGIKSYTKIKTPIYLQDAMATALDLANVDKPTHVEFKSIMPLINENKKVQYPKIYGKYMNFQRMIIEGDYKLIMYPTINKIKLFNLYKDPMETNNLADHPEYHFKAKILKNSLISLQKKMGDNLDLEHPKRQKGDLSIYESH